MCAIAGYLDLRADFRSGLPFDPSEVQRVLKHRGPDGEGSVVYPQAVLVHTRLSVIDPENGRQPMQARYGDREYCIVYNGELYNADELRRALTLRGHRFLTRCDTEVLLKAYIEWGASCVERCNGIFAFAVWDAAERRLFIARDRMGVKPFFYAARPDGFCFASEIKGLFAFPGLRPAVDTQSIAELLLVGPGRTPGCGVFVGVEELRAGWCGFVDASGVRLRRYWRLEDADCTDSFDQAVEKTRALVLDAIERQLVSDVPIGTFLSGGLDSSLISSVAARRLAARGERLSTFSVGYRDNARYFAPSRFQPNSDEDYIGRMVDALQSDHHSVILDTDELVEALFDAVLARDLPGMADIDASLWLFCRSIRQHVTVALSGECADELFGGYPWFYDPELRRRHGFPWAQSTAYRAGFLQPAFAERIDPEAYMEERYQQTAQDVSCRVGQDARAKTMTRLNTDWFMQTLLDRKDRMSMAHGLEVRVPFCDHRLAAYLYTLPWDYQYRDGVEKSLLRRAAEGLLPNQVLWRKKSPYPKTHHPAYTAAVEERLRRMLQQPNAPLLQLVRRDALERLLSGEEQVQWYGQLMTRPQTMAYFLQLHHWLTAYRVEMRD